MCGPPLCLAVLGRSGVEIGPVPTWTQPGSSRLGAPRQALCALGTLLPGSRLCVGHRVIGVQGVFDEKKIKVPLSTG